MDVMATVCWFCSSLWFSALPGGESLELLTVDFAAPAAADSGRMTQIKSPETMPQDDRV